MIDSFIVDFYSKEWKLVIEVDDESHNVKWRYDEKRTFLLESLGIQVVRFTNDEVLDNRDEVVESIKKYINDFSLEKYTHPNPS